MPRFSADPEMIRRDHCNNSLALGAVKRAACCPASLLEDILAKSPLPVVGEYCELLEISIIRKGFPIWIAHAAYEGNDDRHGFQTPLSLIEPGQSLRNRVDLVVVTPMWERKELGN